MRVHHGLPKHETAGQIPPCPFHLFLAKAHRQVSCAPGEPLLTVDRTPVGNLDDEHTDLVLVDLDNDAPVANAQPVER